MKSVATTKVALNNTRSNPLRVNEVADPHDFVSPPLLLGCTRIRTVNSAAKIISVINSVVRVSIFKSIHYFNLEKKINP